MDCVAFSNLVAVESISILEDSSRVNQAHAVGGCVTFLGNQLLEIEHGLSGLDGDDVFLVVGCLDVDGDGFRHYG